MDSTELELEESERPAIKSRRGGEQQALESEHLLWAQFAEADSVEGFCGSWLAILCRMIGGVSGGMVLLGPPGSGPYTPVAVWPDARRNMAHLTAAAECALRERRGLLQQQQSGSHTNREQPSYHIAYPLEVENTIHGVVVLDVDARPESQLQMVLRQLHWASAWIETLIRRQNADQSDQTKNNLIAVIDFVAVALEQERFYAAALGLATELATRLHCNRVSIGFLRKNRMVVEAVSHSAQFEKKTNLVTTIGRVMDEAYDQKASIHYPPPDSEKATPLVTRVHRQHSIASDNVTLYSVLLYLSGQIIGAITLEKSEGNSFDENTIKLCESVAALSGPVLEDKRKNDLHLLQKIAASGHRQIEKLIGARHVAYKLVASTSILLLFFLMFATGDYRVSAKTVIEGEIQRVITSPFQGYVSQANARAGDIVTNGQTLAVLEDKDLKLEHMKSVGQKEQLLSQYREAMANHDRVKIRITMAQLSQIEAQIELLSYQLARTQIVAPFDGVLVNGDLSQSLGAPVEKGDVLFEIAPLDAYRVILQVDERDISDVAIEQEGKLALSSLTGEIFDFVVEKITPVSTADEGRNYFRVEARILLQSERLRPGMEGIGKIYIERRKLIWVWTHRFTEWFRLWAWSWLP